MFINKTEDGRNNLCGSNVAKFRKEMKISQRIPADRLQLVGPDVDKNAIQRIEAGKRFVTDIELVALCKVLGITLHELLSENSPFRFGKCYFLMENGRWKIFSFHKKGFPLEGKAVTAFTFCELLVTDEAEMLITLYRFVG